MPIFISQLFESGDFSCFRKKKVASVIIHPNTRELAKVVDSKILGIFGPDYEAYLTDLSEYMRKNNDPHVFLLPENLFEFEEQPTFIPPTNKLYERTFHEYPHLRPKGDDVIAITLCGYGARFSFKLKHYVYLTEVLTRGGIKKLDVMGELGVHPYEGKTGNGCVDMFIEAYKEEFKINNVGRFIYPRTTH